MKQLFQLLGNRQYMILIPERRGNSEHHNHINHLVALFEEKKHWEEKTQKSHQVNIERSKMRSTEAARICKEKYKRVRNYTE